MKAFIISLVLLLCISCMSRNPIRSAEHTEHQKHGELCRSKSTEWLLANAKFPDSYRPVSFSSIEETAIIEPQEYFFFSTARTIPDSEHFSIIHEYYIADAQNRPTLLYSKFVFDHAFNVTEFVYSTQAFSFSDSGLPGELQWKSLYGKSLDNSPSEQH
jgi:hypothetical protein